MKFNFSVKYVTYYFNIKVNQRYFEISFRQPEREKKNLSIISCFSLMQANLLECKYAWLTPTYSSCQDSVKKYVYISATVGLFEN